MGYVYLADQKNLRKKSASKERSAKALKSKSVREKSDKESWGDTMGGVFKIIAWIGKNRIYNMFKYTPISLLNGIGHLLGRFAFGSSRKVLKRTQASLRALFPDYTQKRIQKLTDTHVRYMGMFLLDVIFRLPSTCDFPPNTRVKYYKYLNFEKLDALLAKGKGVIVPILHIGEHFHSPGGIFLHPNQYKMSTVISIKNLPMYEFNNRAHFRNLFMYASTKFSTIKAQLKQNLENGHTLVMYHDYSSTSQLRVPFIENKFPYLIHTPQSYIRLHKLTGAEILPLITVPDGTFGNSKLFFLDNTSIMETSRKYWDAPSSEFHGQLSTEINRQMYPYVRQYAPYWEEIMRFAGLRCADKIKFHKNCTLAEGIDQMQGKMISILENSWEPNRKDEALKAKITQMMPIISKSLKNPNAVIREHKSFIDLSLMSAKDEILKILCIILKICNGYSENEAVKNLRTLEKGILSI